MKRTILASLLVFILTSISSAQNSPGNLFQINTYTFSPLGKFARLFVTQGINITPQNPGATPCTFGDIIIDENGNIKTCNLNGSWGFASDAWTRDPDKNSVHTTNPLDRVGIGISIPQNKLHVASGSVMFEGIYDPLSSIINRGNGSRLQWDPQRAAFRVGVVDADLWDDAYVGDFSSVVGGYANLASGDYATVIGGQTNAASGYRATSIGGASHNASGTQAIVVGGENVLATGDYSAAFNTTNVSLGDSATSIGRIPGFFGSFLSDNSTVVWGKNVGINGAFSDATFNVQGRITLGNIDQKGFAVRDGQESYVMRGFVNSDGTYETTNNYLVITKTATGTYNFDYTDINFYSKPFFSFTPISPGAGMTYAKVTALTEDTLTVKTINQAGMETDKDFAFYCIGTLNNTVDGEISITPGQELIYRKENP